MNKINFVSNARVTAHKGHFPNWETFDIQLNELADAPIYDKLAKIALDDTILSIDLFDYSDRVDYIINKWDGISVSQWRGGIYEDGHITKDLVDTL